MAFWTDKQTLEDLNLLGKFKKNSIINHFDRTHTRRGAMLLETMFREPLTDVESINRRSAAFRYFAGQGLRFPATAEQIAQAESYLNGVPAGNGITSLLHTCYSRLKQVVASDKEYEKMQEGLAALLGTIVDFADLYARLDPTGSPIRERAEAVFAVFGPSEVEQFRRERNESLSLSRTIACNRLFHIRCRNTLKELFDLIYELDVFLSVASVAAERGFCYAEALPAGDRVTEIAGLYHPSLSGGVANDVCIDAAKNVFFLTGANMAGKSTFMKSFSVALYLAHMGFPVAASRMRFSLLDGIYTSINVPDNIALGYSHFYAEVLRVKHIAEQVSAGKNLLVVFDELFKGTNVKDAFDATVAVTEAFAGNRNCQFIVSTHIIEAAAALADRCDNIQFHYFPTEMDGTRPVYTYRLAVGVTADRHGMMIINNEHILEIIRGEYAGDEDNQ